METVAPLEEVLELIKDTGGESYRFCFQCGLCDAVCPTSYLQAEYHLTEALAFPSLAHKRAAEG